MYGNQYNQDVQNQMSAAGQYGNFANQDVANRLNANQALASTDAQQQQLRQAGTQLYGNLADSQQSQRQNALNSNRDFQLQGLNLQSGNYQNNIANMLASNDQRMNAANAANSQQNALNTQKLNAASMAGDTYQNQYLPQQQLANVGAARDDRAALELQAEINKWDRSQQQPIQNVANFVNLLNGGGYSNTTTPVYSNSASQAIGGLSALAGLFSLCDVREKILHIRLPDMPLTNGEFLEVWVFSYKDDPEQKIYSGPIAQEVEAKTGAVVEINDRKHIDIEAFMKEVA
ncbi:hypothetical protein [Sinorhizobium psoraleae]|uniref:Uncharacterized protein n=1 Tax=Sinorhizobium psoraleae TaxID=520838 RepID=A0ABT4KAS7_9HYPH|nr:hypothetical protein [Sinorhizobium psoraleae]MCZ4089073.1 hypothetical protein [Sinorhizobium psoraleae]